MTACTELNLHPFTLSSKIVAVYDIELKNKVSAKITLKERANGIREFEVVVSGNISDEYAEVCDHPFYKDVVVPWVNNQHTIVKAKCNVVNNIIQFPLRSRNEKTNI